MFRSSLDKRGEVAPSFWASLSLSPLLFLLLLFLDSFFYWMRGRSFDLLGGIALQILQRSFFRLEVIPSNGNNSILTVETLSPSLFFLKGRKPENREPLSGSRPTFLLSDFILFLCIKPTPALVRPRENTTPPTCRRPSVNSSSFPPFFYPVAVFFRTSFSPSGNEAPESFFTASAGRRLARRSENYFFPPLSCNDLPFLSFFILQGI